MRIPIIYGKKLYGKVDHGENQLHIATMFFHIWFIPLFPLGSFIVFENGGKFRDFQGVKTRLNFKSVLVTYLRLILVVAGIPFTFVGVMGLLAGLGYETFLIPLIIGIVSFLTVSLSYEFVRANAETAQRLVERAELTRSPAFSVPVAWNAPLSSASQSHAALSKDRYYTVTVGPKEAKTGTDIFLELAHLPDKRKIKISVPAGLTKEKKLRIKGLGIPGGYGEMSGDVYVTIEVRKPSPFWKR